MTSAWFWSFWFGVDFHDKSSKFGFCHLVCGCKSQSVSQSVGLVWSELRGPSSEEDEVDSGFFWVLQPELSSAVHHAGFPWNSFHREFFFYCVLLNESDC